MHPSARGGHSRLELDVDEKLLEALSLDCRVALADKIEAYVTIFPYTFPWTFQGKIIRATK